MNVSEAVDSRMSCRAFRPDPIPEATVRRLLEKAARAPSGGNLQPWHVIAVTGEPLTRLKADTLQAVARGEVGMKSATYDVYPRRLPEPYRARRSGIGEAMYDLLGIGREDKAGRMRQFADNFRMFGAPVGLFIYLHDCMGPPQWADCGMFLQSLMLLAREEGLHTCPQEAWAMAHSVVDAQLQPDEGLSLFCAVALGHRDEDAPVNRLRADRAGVEDFARLKGF